MVTCCPSGRLAPRTARKHRSLTLKDQMTLKTAYGPHIGILIKHGIWFIGSLILWFIGSLILWFIGSLIPWFIGSSSLARVGAAFSAGAEISRSDCLRLSCSFSKTRQPCTWTSKVPKAMGHIRFILDINKAIMLGTLEVYLDLHSSQNYCRSVHRSLFWVLWRSRKVGSCSHALPRPTFKAGLVQDATRGPGAGR